MEVTYEFLSSTNAQNALQELFGTRFDTETTLKVSRIKHHFDRILKHLQKDAQALVEKYGVYDLEKKDWARDPRNELGVKLKPELENEAIVEIDKLRHTKVEFDRCEKLPVSLIKEISADHLMALSPILDGLDF